MPALRVLAMRQRLRCQYARARLGCSRAPCRLMEDAVHKVSNLSMRKPSLGALFCRIRRLQWSLIIYNRTCLCNRWMLIAGWGHIHTDMSDRILVVSSVTSWRLLCKWHGLCCRFLLLIISCDNDRYVHYDRRRHCSDNHNHIYHNLHSNHDLYRL